MHAHTLTGTHSCTFACSHTRTCCASLMLSSSWMSFAHACIHACVHAHMSTSTLMHARAHTHECASTQAGHGSGISPHKCMCTHAHTHACMYAHTRAGTRARMCRPAVARAFTSRARSSCRNNEMPNWKAGGYLAGLCPQCLRVCMCAWTCMQSADDGSLNRH